MEANSKNYQVKRMASALGVSRQSYYDYKKRCKDDLEKYNPDILNHLKTIWAESRKTYGVMRLTESVKKIDESYGKRKVRKMMKLLGIQGKQAKKHKIYTTDSRHNGRIARDLVQRNFSPSEKNKVWVSDVTFLRKLNGWLYLCVIIDLYSRKVVGWSLSQKNDSELITSALDKAIKTRKPNKGLIFHSDRGSNYCSNETRLKLIKNKILRSNSRKGNCWDNAVSESYFSTLKREIGANVYSNIEDAKFHIFDYIEIFYNRQRMHSFLEYKSPDEYEKMAA